MEITLLPQHWSAILCIGIMIGALLIGYFRKYMITYALIFANIIIFIISYIFMSEIIFGTSQYPGLGFRAIYLTTEYFPQTYTIFTSMFIHGGFFHIFGNMLIFFFMGMPFEQRIGWKKFLIIYLITGIIGTLTHSILNLGSTVPLIGASGAIFGIMGAFAFSYPNDKVVLPIPLGFIMLLRRIKVIYGVLFFIILETVIVWYESTQGMQSNTAHFAHFGGLISGFIIAALFLRRKSVSDSASFQTTYYDSFVPQKPSQKDYSELRKLATTPELKEMLNKIEKETVPQVRDIWLEHFLEKTICPKCKNPLNHFDDKIWCEYCDFRTNY